jgi:hypothetical protein
MANNETKEESVFEGDGKLTTQEIDQLKLILELFPIHNHDGRNSQNVATKKVLKSLRSEEIRPNTSAIAGESIGNGDGVRIGEEDNIDDIRIGIEQTEHGNSSTEFFRYQLGADFSQRAAQSFTTGTLSEKLKSIITEFIDTGGADNNISGNIELRADNNGEPGSLIATTVTRVNDFSSDQDEEFVFSTIQDLDPETKYWWVMKSTATLIIGGIATMSVRRVDNDETKYKGGEGLYSDDNGATWTPTNGDHYFKLRYADTGGRIYKSVATTQALADRYLGVSNKGVNQGSTPEIISIGNKIDFSNLTPGEVYYITDTRGALNTSAGTITKKIGLALNEKNMFIKEIQ